MKALLRPALTLFATLTVLTGVVYPFAVTGISQLLFPHEANGSIVTVKGKPVGSALIGQQFTSPGNLEGAAPRPPVLIPTTLRSPAARTLGRSTRRSPTR